MVESAARRRIARVRASKTSMLKGLVMQSSAPHSRLADDLSVLAQGGENDDRDIGEPADPPTNLPAIDHGHHKVEEHHVRVSRVELAQPILPIKGSIYPSARNVEDLRQHVEQLRVVVDYQDFNPLQLAHCFRLGCCVVDKLGTSLMQKRPRCICPVYCLLYTRCRSFQIECSLLVGIAGACKRELRDSLRMLVVRRGH